jgi:hypothetical protein
LESQTLVNYASNWQEQQRRGLSASAAALDSSTREPSWLQPTINQRTSQQQQHHMSSLSASNTLPVNYSVRGHRRAHSSSNVLDFYGGYSAGTMPSSGYSAAVLSSYGDYDQVNSRLPPQPSLLQQQAFATSVSHRQQQQQPGSGSGFVSQPLVANIQPQVASGQTAVRGHRRTHSTGFADHQLDQSLDWQQRQFNQFNSTNGTLLQQQTQWQQAQQPRVVAASGIYDAANTSQTFATVHQVSPLSLPVSATESLPGHYRSRHQQHSAQFSFDGLGRDQATVQNVGYQPHTLQRAEVTTYETVSSHQPTVFVQQPQRTLYSDVPPPQRVATGRSDVSSVQYNTATFQPRPQPVQIISSSPNPHGLYNGISTVVGDTRGSSSAAWQSTLQPAAQQLQPGVQTASQAVGMRYDVVQRNAINGPSRQQQNVIIASPREPNASSRQQLQQQQQQQQQQTTSYNAGTNGPRADELLQALDTFDSLTRLEQHQQLQSNTPQRVTAADAAPVSGQRTINGLTTQQYQSQSSWQQQSSAGSVTPGSDVSWRRDVNCNMAEAEASPIVADSQMLGLRQYGNIAAASPDQQLPVANGFVSSQTQRQYVGGQSVNGSTGMTSSSAITPDDYTIKRSEGTRLKPSAAGDTLQRASGASTDTDQSSSNFNADRSSAGSLSIFGGQWMSDRQLRTLGTRLR